MAFVFSSSAGLKSSEIEAVEILERNENNLLAR